MSKPTLEQQKAILAGAVRNHMVSPGSIFSPLHGVSLVYQNGMLCKVTRHENGEKGFTPLKSVLDLFEMTDNQIWKLVMK